MAKFAHSLKQFEPIAWQLSNSDLTRIQDVVAPLLIQIPYGKTGALHNLISIIQLEAAYITRYDAAFPKPSRIGAYCPSIDNNATSIVFTRTEAAHKAKRADHATYKTARQEMAQFILALCVHILMQGFTMKAKDTAEQGIKFSCPKMMPCSDGTAPFSILPRLLNSSHPLLQKQNWGHFSSHPKKWWQLETYWNK